MDRLERPKRRSVVVADTGDLRRITPYAPRDVMASAKRAEVIRRAEADAIALERPVDERAAGPPQRRDDPQPIRRFALSGNVPIDACNFVQALGVKVSARCGSTT